MTSNTIKLQVRVEGIVDGNPPLLAFSKLLTQEGDKRKLHTQRIQIADPTLLARLRRDVCTGDEVEIVLETDWSKPDIPTLLKDFSRIRSEVVKGLFE